MASYASVHLKDHTRGSEFCIDNPQGLNQSESGLNYLYQLDVFTAVPPGSRTYSDVQIKLEGSHSKTDWLTLTQSHPNEAEKITFPNGSKKQYIIATKGVIGLPEQVHFKLLACPRDSNNYNWTVDHLIITELSNQTQWMVQVNQTLYADTYDDCVYTFEDVVTQESASSVFKVNLARGFMRNHLWALWNKNETNLGVFTTLALLINIILGILTVNAITILLKGYEQYASQIYISVTQIRYLSLGYCGTVMTTWGMEWLLRFLQPKDIVNYMEFKNWLSSVDYQKECPLQSFKYYTGHSNHLKDWQTIQPHRYPSNNKLGDVKSGNYDTVHKKAINTGKLGCSVRNKSLLQAGTPSPCNDAKSKHTRPEQKTNGLELVKPRMSIITKTLNPLIAAAQKICSSALEKALRLVHCSKHVSTSIKPSPLRTEWASFKRDMEEIRTIAVDLQETVRESTGYQKHSTLENKNAHNANNDAASQHSDDLRKSLIMNRSDGGTDCQSRTSTQWRGIPEPAEKSANKITIPVKNECVIHICKSETSSKNSDRSGYTVANKKVVDDCLININLIKESRSSHCIIDMEDDTGDICKPEADSHISITDGNQSGARRQTTSFLSQAKISPSMAGLPDVHRSVGSVREEMTPEVCLSASSGRALEKKLTNDTFTLNSNKPGTSVETMIYFLEGKWYRYLTSEGVKNTRMGSRSVLFLLLIVACVFAAFCVTKGIAVGGTVYYKVVVYWGIAVMGHLLLLEPVKSLLSVGYTTYIAKKFVRW